MPFHANNLTTKALFNLYFKCSLSELFFINIKLKHQKQDYRIFDQNQRPNAVPIFS
jgi:hypothetical protein